MSDTNLLLISIVVFCLLIAGLYLMVREFMGQVSDAFPDVNEWLDSDKKKKKWAVIVSADCERWLWALIVSTAHLK